MTTDPDDDDVIAAIARRAAPTRAELDRLAERMKAALADASRGAAAPAISAEMPSVTADTAELAASGSGVDAGSAVGPGGGAAPPRGGDGAAEHTWTQAEASVSSHGAVEAVDAGSAVGPVAGAAPPGGVSAAAPATAPSQGPSIGASPSRPRPANRGWAWAVAALAALAALYLLRPSPAPEERLRGPGGGDGARAAEVDELTLEVERVRDGRAERWLGEPLQVGDTVVFRARSLRGGVVGMRAESGLEAEEITVAELPAGRMVDVRRGAERPGFQFDRAGPWRLVASLDGPLCAPRRCVIVEVEVR